MEEENKIEQAVKELLFEQALREKLQKIDNRKRFNFYLLSSIAALFVLVIGFFIIQILLNKEVDRTGIIAQNFEFPDIVKSRSSEFSLVDSFIPELNKKQYDLVIKKLYKDSLSEKDQFVKANILFVMDSLNESETIVKATTWNDPFHKAETDWLIFLIQFKKGTSKNELIRLSKLLQTPYTEKAKLMLEQLKD